MADSNLPVPVPGQGTALMAAGETSSSAIAAREKAAVEARYVIAQRVPRNPDQARVRLLARCESPLFAEVAEYEKPVGGGKKARGASIRMMEECARQWGNIDVQAMVVFDDAQRRIFRVVACDLETNYPGAVDVVIEKTVERKAPRQGDEVLSSRTNSQNEVVFKIVADEDAFLVKQNANISKARREMLRAVIPGDLVEEAMQKCRETRQSETKKDPAKARKRLADAFYAHGVMPQQLCELLGKPSLEALNDAEVEWLRSIYTAIRDGEATWADVMEARRQEKSGATAEAPAAEGKGTISLKDKLRGRAPAKPAEEKPVVEAVAEPEPTPTNPATNTAPPLALASEDDEAAILAEDARIAAADAAKEKKQ